MRKILSLLLLTVALLQSCSTPPPPAINDPRVRVTAPYKWDVSVIAIGEREGENGILEMQVEFFNKTSDTEHLEYKIYWYDQSNFKIDTILCSQWKPRTISGNGHFAVNEIGPTKNAKNFLLHVRNKEDGKIVVAVDSRLK